MEGVKLKAIVAKVQTLREGGWRITLDIPKSHTPQALMVGALTEMVLDVTIEPESEGLPMIS
jgi:hypothetical protein